MDTNRKGNISETKVLNAFAQAGCVALLPFGIGAPYDLVVDIHGHLLKVQVKTGRLRNGCVIFPVKRFSEHKDKVGKYQGRKYEDCELDLFAAYCHENDTVYLMSAKLGNDSSEGRLRISQTKNNQRQKIRWAHEFELNVFLGGWQKELVELRGLEPLTS